MCDCRFLFLRPPPQRVVSDATLRIAPRRPTCKFLFDTATIFNSNSLAIDSRGRARVHRRSPSPLSESGTVSETKSPMEQRGGASTKTRLRSETITHFRATRTSFLQSRPIHLSRFSKGRTLAQRHFDLVKFSFRHLWNTHRNKNNPRGVTRASERRRDSGLRASRRERANRLRFYSRFHLRPLRRG